MSSFPGHTRQILQYAIMTVYGKFAIFVAKITSIFRLLKGIMKNLPTGISKIYNTASLETLLI